MNEIFYILFSLLSLGMQCVFILTACLISDEAHFKDLVTTCGSWLQYWAAQFQRLGDLLGAGNLGGL